MGRIIKNKHYENSAYITAESFDDVHGLSEIVISNEKGAEGIYVKNTDGDVVKVGNGSGSSNFKQYFVTVEEYENLKSNNELDEDAFYAVYEPDNQE